MKEDGLQHYWKGFAVLVLGFCAFLAWQAKEVVQSTPILQGNVQLGQRVAPEDRYSWIRLLQEKIPGQADQCIIGAKTGAGVTGYLARADETGIVLATVDRQEKTITTVLVPWSNIASVRVCNKRE